MYNRTQFEYTPMKTYPYPPTPSTQHSPLHTTPSTHHFPLHNTPLYTPLPLHTTPSSPLPSTHHSLYRPLPSTHHSLYTPLPSTQHSPLHITPLPSPPLPSPHGHPFLNLGDNMLITNVMMLQMWIYVYFISSYRLCTSSQKYEIGW